MDLLNTQQYLEMRGEAFYNDSVNGAFFYAPGSLNPDLLICLNGILTGTQIGKKNYLEELLKLLMHRYIYQERATRLLFRFGAGYHKETMVFPADSGL